MKEILEYQKIDGDLWALEKELRNCEAKQKMDKLSETLNSLKDALLELDRNAVQTLNEFKDTSKMTEVTLKNVDLLTKQNLDELDLKKVRKIIEQTNIVSKNVLSVEKKISTLQGKIDQALNFFNKTSNDINNLKKNYLKEREVYNEKKEQLEPQIDAIKKQLEGKAKLVDKAIMEKYNKIRKDRKYPVFVPLDKDGCSGCRMKLASAELEKIKNEKMIECEQCHRWIYMPED